MSCFVQGDPTAPASVKLQQQSAGILFELVGPTASGLTFGGFTLLGHDTSASTNAFRVIDAVANFFGVPSPPSIIIDGFGFAGLVYESSVLYASNSLKIQNCADGFSLRSHSIVHCWSCNLIGTGAGTAFTLATSSAVYINDATIATWNKAVWCTTNGNVYRIYQSTLNSITTPLATSCVASAYDNTIGEYR
jgi:hypothetical protein